MWTRFLGNTASLSFTVDAPPDMTTTTLPENDTIVASWGMLEEVIKPPLGSEQRASSAALERPATAHPVRDGSVFR